MEWFGPPQPEGKAFGASTSAVSRQVVLEGILDSVGKNSVKEPKATDPSNVKET